MRIFIILLISITILTGCVFDKTEGPLPGETREIPEQNIEAEEPGAAEQNAAEVTDEANQATADFAEQEPVRVEQPEEQIDLPATFDNDIDFASQAPFGNWALPYQEACEESSLIMVARYFENQEITKSIMDQEIHKVVDWENQNLGLYTDTNAEEVVRIAKEYFGLNAKIVEDVSVERIKTELVKGNLIIAPFAGRELGNPNYTAPGPLYHMLVIRGYDRNEFITNDVGTRRGEKYKYKYQTLINAIHDLPNYDDGSVFRPYDDKSMPDSQKAEKMVTGRKVMIVLWP